VLAALLGRFLPRLGPQHEHVLRPLSLGMPVLRSIGQKLGPPRSVKVKQAPKVVQSFYLSPEWRALMDQIITERFGSRERARCEDLECKNPQRIGIRVFGDHIKELKDGGARLDKRNVLCRCGSCHSRKTMAERTKRYQG
jgi:5-methylcytosine-specific restriction protein A